MRETREASGRVQTELSHERRRGDGEKMNRRGQSKREREIQGGQVDQETSREPVAKRLRSPNG